MPIDLISSVYKKALTVYSKALTFLGIGMASSQTAYTELPSLDSPIPISAFCDQLRTQYRADGSARMKKLFVTEVRLCKMMKTPQHEYLSATICDPNGHIVAYLSFERFRGSIVENTSPSATPSESPLSQPSESQPMEEAEWKSPSSSSSNRTLFTLPSSSDIVAISSESLLDERYANDKVGRLPAPSRPNSHIHRILSFKAKPLLLWELALLAHVIHMRAEKYYIFSNNCYFYSGAIVKVLEEVYGSNVPPESQEHAETSHMRRSDKENMIPLGGQRGPGKCHNVTIYSEEDTDINPIIEQFTKDKKKFEEIALARDKEAERAQNAALAEKQRKAAEEREAQALEAQREAIEESERLRQELRTAQKAKEEQELNFQRELARLRLENERMSNLKLAN